MYPSASTGNNFSSIPSPCLFLAMKQKTCCGSPTEANTVLVKLQLPSKNLTTVFSFSTKRYSRRKKYTSWVGPARRPQQRLTKLHSSSRFPHFTHCSITIKICLDVCISPVELALSEWDMDVPIGHGLTW